MTFSFAQLVVWAIVGLIAGSLVGFVVKGGRKGFGLPANLGLGLAGALVGGLAIRLFGLFPELDRVTVSLRDVVAAVLGSALVLLAIWIKQTRAPSA